MGIETKWHSIPCSVNQDNRASIYSPDLHLMVILTILLLEYLEWFPDYPDRCSQNIKNLRKTNIKFVQL